MTITKDNLPHAIAALRQCARENEGKAADTGSIRVSDLCRDVADYLDSVPQTRQAPIDEETFKPLDERLAGIIRSCEGKRVFNRLHLALNRWRHDLHLLIYRYITKC